jgi:hypothetical protein
VDGFQGVSLTSLVPACMASGYGCRGASSLLSLLGCLAMGVERRRSFRKRWRSPASSTESVAVNVPAGSKERLAILSFIVSDPADEGEIVGLPAQSG